MIEESKTDKLKIHEAKEEKMKEAVEVVQDAITVSRIYYKYAAEPHKVDTVLDAGYDGLRQLDPRELQQIAIFKERISQVTCLLGLMFGGTQMLKALDKIMLKAKMDKIMEPQ